MVEAIEEVNSTLPRPVVTMSATTCLVRCTVERTLRSIRRSSVSSGVSLANAPPMPIPALRAKASTGRPPALRWW